MVVVVVVVVVMFFFGGRNLQRKSSNTTGEVQARLIACTNSNMLMRCRLLRFRSSRPPAFTAFVPEVRRELRPLQSNPQPRMLGDYIFTGAHWVIVNFRLWIIISVVGQGTLRIISSGRC